MTKYIFVTGGVLSGLGKGVSVASIGRILKARGVRVTTMKLDPYLNVDPGTMSPYQHGEVFVTNDGAETDLDLGHYERFVDENLSQLSNVTSGQIYNYVIEMERRGDYLGGTIQVIPHVTNEIKRRIGRVARTTQADVVLVEIGGTVGDIEGLPFLEAIRQMRKDVGRSNTLFIHLTWLPYLAQAKSLKLSPRSTASANCAALASSRTPSLCAATTPLKRACRRRSRSSAMLNPRRLFRW